MKHLSKLHFGRFPYPFAKDVKREWDGNHCQRDESEQAVSPSQAKSVCEYGEAKVSQCCRMRTYVSRLGRPILDSLYMFSPASGSRPPTMDRKTVLAATALAA